MFTRRMIRFWCSSVAMFMMGALAQNNPPKPLDPSKARTDYSFSIRPGMEPFRFHVDLNKRMVITGVSIFRPGESSPFQVLPACEEDLTMELNEYDEGRELLQHADLNFDGFEDLELLHLYHPHLATSVFCIFVWDDKARQFRYAPEFPNVNPEPHPATKTITVHQDYFGGVYQDRTHRWNGAKIELVEENGNTNGSEDPNCGFTSYCSRLINGEMVITAERPSGCSGKPDVLLVCSPDAPQLRKKKRTVRSQD